MTVGLNLSNNGSICMMRGKKILFYLESERITRKKYDTVVREMLQYVYKKPHAIGIVDCYWDAGSKTVLSSRDVAAVK